MLTIRAMAQMGPWLLDRIDVLDGRDEHCMRCSTKIKNVWVMDKQTEPSEAWRIGSCCGPQLEELSEELWTKATAPFGLSLRHLTTLERIREWERDYPSLAPHGYRLGWAGEQQQDLSRVLSAHERRIMGRDVSRALTDWKRSFRRHDAAIRDAALRAGLPLPISR